MSLADIRTDAKYGSASNAKNLTVNKYSMNQLDVKTVDADLINTQVLVAGSISFPNLGNNKVVVTDNNAALDDLTLFTSGGLPQILGGNNSAIPTPLNILESNGCDVQYDGVNNLTFSMTQDLQTGANPTFSGLTVSNLLTTNDLSVGNNVNITGNISNVNLIQGSGPGTWFNPSIIGSGTELNAPKINVQGNSGNDLIVFTNVGPTILDVDAPQAAGRRYNIPDVGADAKFVMTAGAQTVAGVKTFSSPLTLSSSPGQLISTDGGGNQILQFQGAATPNTYTIPDVGGDSVNVILTRSNMGAQQIDDGLTVGPTEGIHLSRAFNQLSFGSGGNQILVTTTPSGVITYTLPHVLANANFLLSTRTVVSQLTSITTDVTSNASTLVITTQNATNAGLTTVEFKLVNSLIAAASPVSATLVNYSGVYQTNGVPYITINNILAGSCMVKVSNIHALNALSGVLKIAIIVG